MLFFFPSNYSLREVSVGEGGVVKQRRLPDQLQNLAERIGLSSRYYLKNNASTEPLVPDELATVCIVYLPDKHSISFKKCITFLVISYNLKIMTLKYL